MNHHDYHYRPPWNLHGGSRPNPQSCAYIKRVLLKDSKGKMCPICNQTINQPSIDHIIPKAEGGSDVRENLRAVCLKCNIKRGAPNHKKAERYDVAWRRERREFEATHIIMGYWRDVEGNRTPNWVPTSDSVPASRRSTSC